MPQKSLASLFENERHKASAFRDPPGVQRAIRKNFSFSSREKSPLVYSPIPRPERFLLALASRTAPSIVLTPHQCLTDHLVLVGANEMPQEPFGGLLVNERGEAGAFWASPSVQLDHMMAVINASLKRCRVPHFSNRRTLHPRATKKKFTGPNSQQIACELIDVRSPSV